MLDINKVNDLVEFINTNLSTKFSKNISALYLVGGYSINFFNSSRPDIDWLVIWDTHPTSEMLWELGLILTDGIDKFEPFFTVKPEFRPFNFTYAIKKTEHDVFVNFSQAYAGSNQREFEFLNDHIPVYVLAGFQASRNLVLGTDILKDYHFNITSELIMSHAYTKIMSHKVLLDRIPLTYHLHKETDLVFNASMSHFKKLLYYLIEMFMTDSELAERKFLEVFHHYPNQYNFFKERDPDVLPVLEFINQAKTQYPIWKYDKSKAKEVYLATENLSYLMLTKV